ncbi:HK97 family phage prohead protease [Novosphingobium sp. NPDC080210]|uniref:HK97 family phage prohead protease n=1 Tax=Novosphingobium sp. NPDC080210 TaxID=3390596 RepID=UPI003CFD3F88
MTMERRALTAAPELRADGGAKVARGYAALFNSETDIGGYFREKIAPGAFKDAIGGDIRALIDHDTGRVIGRSASGTLRLSEDEKGLFVEIDLPDTTDGRDLAVQLERGDISGMSFGFAVTHDEWDETGDIPLRTIHAVELFEVSAVAFPAYGDTSIALRSRDEARKEREKSEERKQHNQEGYLKRKAEQEQRFRRI